MTALAFAYLVPPEPVLAQNAQATGVVSGTVTSADGAPVGGASVTLQGPTPRSAQTDAKGAFSFTNVAPGTYSVVVSKSGFSPSQQDDVFVVAGSSTNVGAVLAQSSFSSLRQIGRVSTNVPGRATINSTPASVAVISNQVFADQGQLQVTKILDETPGVLSSPVGYSGTSRGAPQITQIRGALPYETESLIDGHPVSVGTDGSFSPIFLNPALLQNIELVKGPGATTTEINYAINGSVNYRTLEPTRTPQQTLQYGVDGFGGMFTSLQATGSTLSHRVDYAFALATDGTPSAVHNYTVAGSQVPLIFGLPPWTVNGQVVAQFPLGTAPSQNPQFNSTPGQARYAQPVYLCCAHASAGYDAKAELAKLRFNFSQTTALTLSYLGGQAHFDDYSELSSLFPISGTNQSFSTFTPPPGYTGSVPAGRAIPFDTLANNPNTDWSQQNLLQAEFRTSLSPSDALLARYYTGFSNGYITSATGNNSITSFGGTAWGGLLLCSPGTGLINGGCGATPTSTPVAPVMTYFNGTPVVFQSTTAPNVIDILDHLRGYSVELDHTAGRNTYSVSFDRSQHDANVWQDNPLAGVVQYTLSPGSSQQFTTISLRGQFALGPKLNASLSDYLVRYASHYQVYDLISRQALWNDASHNANEPRLGLAWRPSSDLAVRFSTGGSIAPPYISLLSSPGGSPLPNAVGGATLYTFSENNGQISPETAFSYDLGLDTRFARSIGVSADVYFATLHNLFLNSTFQNGTYTPTGGADNGNTEPLYITQTRNLGQARYEGVELAVQRAPLVGFGFRLQGSLERAFTYNLPAGFYDTQNGKYTTNLGVVPNANFFGSSGFYDGIAGGRIPYSSGYGEVNWRTAAGTYYNLGVTYYGPNNGFNQPAFEIVSAAARFLLSKDTTLTITGDNLFGTYGSAFASYMDGVPVPLANGLFAHATTGYLGVTRGSNYGPTTVRIALRHRFGR
ncbi:MAG: TonB-dependent receptor [Candidatus Eremiobacteraeota bacterium]|nr:TonB-dependent receptor [Candidatus Eremiobacteraeota bacterium]